MHKQGSLRWNLPLYNPFHALTLICFCAGFIVVPAGYAGIYRSVSRGFDNNYWEKAGIILTIKINVLERSFIPLKMINCNAALEGNKI